MSPSIEVEVEITVDEAAALIAAGQLEFEAVPHLEAVPLDEAANFIATVNAAGITLMDVAEMRLYAYQKKYWKLVALIDATYPLAYKALPRDRVIAVLGENAIEEPEA